MIKSDEQSHMTENLSPLLSINIVSTKIELFPIWKVWAEPGENLKGTKSGFLEASPLYLNTRVFVDFPFSPNKVTKTRASVPHFFLTLRYIYGTPLPFFTYSISKFMEKNRKFYKKNM